MIERVAVLAHEVEQLVDTPRLLELGGEQRGVDAHALAGLASRYLIRIELHVVAPVSALRSTLVPLRTATLVLAARPPRLLATAATVGRATLSVVATATLPTRRSRSISAARRRGPVVGRVVVAITVVAIVATAVVRVSVVPIVAIPTGL
jgi:hypothetical protein